MERITLYYFIVLVGVILSSSSQILLKKSALTKYKNVVYTILNWRVILAYAIFFIVLMSNIYAMKNGVNLKDLPIIESLGYIFVPILSFLFLKEKITRTLLFSMLLIISGVIIFFI